MESPNDDVSKRFAYAGVPRQGVVYFNWMVTDGCEENDVVPTIDGNGTGLCWVQ